MKNSVLSKYKIIWLLFFVLIVIPYIYLFILSYSRLSEGNRLLYGPYDQCKECISKGESNYTCAMKVADNEAYNFVDSNKRKQDDKLVIQSRTQNLIRKCSTESLENLTQDIYLNISKERGRDNSTIDEVRKACLNPKAAINEFSEKETSDSICHFSSLENMQGKAWPRPSKAEIFFQAAFEPISLFIIFVALFLGFGGH